MAFWLTLTTKEYVCLSLYQSSPLSKNGKHITISYGIIVAKTFAAVLLFQYAGTNVSASYSERSIYHLLKMVG